MTHKTDEEIIEDAVSIIADMVGIIFTPAHPEHGRDTFNSQIARDAVRTALKQKQEQVMEEMTYSEVWLRAWLACAQAANTGNLNVTIGWADRCLEEYKVRFCSQNI